MPSPPPHRSLFVSFDDNHGECAQDVGGKADVEYEVEDHEGGLGDRGTRVQLLRGGERGGEGVRGAGEKQTQHRWSQRRSPLLHIPATTPPHSRHHSSTSPPPLLHIPATTTPHLAAAGVGAWAAAAGRQLCRQASWHAPRRRSLRSRSHSRRERTCTAPSWAGRQTACSHAPPRRWLGSPRYVRSSRRCMHPSAW